MIVQLLLDGFRRDGSHVYKASGSLISLIRLGGV